MPTRIRLAMHARSQGISVNSHACMSPTGSVCTGILVLTFVVASVPQGRQMPPLPAHWVKKLDVLDEVALAERRATHDVVLIQFAVSVQ